MLRSPSPAGSTLPNHALSRLRELQSRRCCLPAEPGLAFSVAVKVERGVQTDLMRRRQCAPCDLDVRNMHTSSTAGRPEPALTTQVPPQLVSCWNHGNLRQLPSSSYDGG